MVEEHSLAVPSLQSDRGTEETIMENVQGFAFDFASIRNAANAVGKDETSEQMLARLVTAMGSVPTEEMRYALMRAHTGLQTLAGRELNKLQAAKGLKDKAGADAAEKSLDALRRMASIALLGHDRYAGRGRWFQSAGKAREDSIRVLEKRGLLDYQGDVLNKKVAEPVVQAVDSLRREVGAIAGVFRLALTLVQEAKAEDDQRRLEADKATAEAEVKSVKQAA